MMIATMLNMANVRAIQIASRIKTSLFGGSPLGLAVHRTENGPAPRLPHPGPLLPLGDHPESALISRLRIRRYQGRAPAYAN
jgi:hypothetical protein